MLEGLALRVDGGLMKSNQALDRLLGGGNGLEGGDAVIRHCVATL